MSFILYFDWLQAVQSERDGLLVELQELKKQLSRGHKRLEGVVVETGEKQENGEDERKGWTEGMVESSVCYIDWFRVPWAGVRGVQHVS